MKTDQRHAATGRSRRFETELGAAVDALFARCPELCGFAVQAVESVSPDLDAAELHTSLYLTDVEIFPRTGTWPQERLFGEVAATLRELVDEHPELGELLCGRTFARVLH